MHHRPPLAPPPSPPLPPPPTAASAAALLVKVKYPTVMGVASGLRTCKSCGHRRPLDDYSAEEWVKGAGMAICAGCVANADGLAEGEAIDTCRDSQDALKGTIENGQLQKPFAQGAFRFVASGRYVGGSLDGKKNVCKWFKTGATFDKTYFSLDIKAVDKAMELVRAFNKEEIIRGIVRVNRPSVWHFKANCGPNWAGKNCLDEPYIHNFEHFNSNTGWSDTSVRWGEVMQALSHFSYHHTRGQFMLVDLQGGVFPGGVILSDPVILSEDRSYEVTDLGPRGISSFFAAHMCTDWCRRSWSKPASRTRYYATVKSTTMEEC